MTDEKMTSKLCPFCKGRGTNIAVDSIDTTTGAVTNPRKVACFVCDGFGSIIPDEP